MDFVKLAKTDPQKLRDLILGGTLGSTDLTFAAEAVFWTNQDMILELLIPLLDHPKPYVREGALIGLQGLTEVSDAILTKIKQISIEDYSPGVRATAQELLNDLKVRL
jgi:HEAT repeat protein